MESHPNWPIEELVRYYVSKDHRDATARDASSPLLPRMLRGTIRRNSVVLRIRLHTTLTISSLHCQTETGCKAPNRLRGPVGNGKRCHSPSHRKPETSAMSYSKRHR